MRKTWAVAKKEILHIVRSPGMLFMVTGAPIFMLILMAYALAADIKSVPIVVLDHDMSTMSRRYVRQITGGSDLEFVGYIDSLQQIDDLLAYDLIRAAVVIRDGFTEEVSALRGFPVQVIVDGSEPKAGGFAFRHIVTHTEAFLHEQIEGSPEGRLNLPQGIDMRLRVWYNPGLSAVQDVVPALIAVILGLPAVSLSAAIAREKEHGSMEQVIATPLSKFELLAGKMIPYVITGVADVFLSLAVAKVLFGVIFRGSLLNLLLFSTVFFVASLSIGLLISIYSRTQQAAMAIALLFFLFPGFFLSGIFFPLVAMPPEARLEANMLPVTQS